MSTHRNEAADRLTALSVARRDLHGVIGQGGHLRIRGIGRRLLTHDQCPEVREVDQEPHPDFALSIGRMQLREVERPHLALLDPAANLRQRLVDRRVGEVQNDRALRGEDVSSHAIERATAGELVHEARLDEHLEAEIQQSARCDMILGYFVRTPAGLIPTGEPYERCPRPADWILRTLCQCGHHGLELLCTPHLYDANIERQCSSCGAYSSFVARTPEHL